MCKIKLIFSKVYPRIVYLYVLATIDFKNKKNIYEHGFFKKKTKPDMETRRKCVYLST